METFPCLVPPGDYLYYCRTDQVKKIYDFRKVKLRSCEKKLFNTSSQSFVMQKLYLMHVNDQKRSFRLFHRMGKNLVFTLHDLLEHFPSGTKMPTCICLICSMERLNRMNVNSNESESYHSWSSNVNGLYSAVKEMMDDSPDPIWYISVHRIISGNLLFCTKGSNSL